MAALQFVIEFAQTDLDTVTPPQLLALYRDLAVFISRDQPASQRPPRLQPFPDRQLDYLQSRALELLRDVAERRGFIVAGDLVLAFWGVAGAGGAIQFVPKGSPLDLLLYQTMRVIEQAGADRLLACQAPVAGDKNGAICGRVFVKVTQKEHCSTRCQMRHYMRKKRQSEREQEMEQLQQAKKGSRYGKTTRTR